jgi:Tol biopolymer transport system component
VAATLIALAVAGPVSATYPADNGLIAFSADTGAGAQIYTIDDRGQHLHQITNLPGDDAVAAHWSPDGQQIAFEVDVADGSCWIGLMNADGSRLVNLTGLDPTICEQSPTFTPDGTRLVFERGPACLTLCTPPWDGLWSMNMNGGDRRLITTALGHAAAWPAISPDGRQVAFVACGPDPNLPGALFTCWMDGSHLAQLTPFAIDVQVKLDWSPDGRHILFTGRTDPTNDSLNMATIQPDGHDLRWLTTYTGGDLGTYAGSYSPDGAWIVYRHTVGGQFALEELPEHVAPVLRSLW